MTELTYQQKQSLGAIRHALDTHTFFDDLVPAVVTEIIQALATELGPLPPVHVPLRKDDHGVYGWPADGIREKIRADGGSIQYGWRMREWPGVLLTAEPHAVWVDPDGTLVDITPDVADGDTSLFVPVASDSDPFDFDHRPPNRYLVLYAVPDQSEAVTGRIAQMKSGQRAYEERRAQKAGITLEEWILEKYYTDPLPARIAAFIAACDESDARLPTLPGMIEDEEAELLGSIPDVVDNDDAIDDPDDRSDKTWLAADSLEEWSEKRDVRREAIVRTLQG